MYIACFVSFSLETPAVCEAVNVSSSGFEASTAATIALLPQAMYHVRWGSADMQFRLRTNRLVRSKRSLIFCLQGGAHMTIYILEYVRHRRASRILNIIYE